MEDTRTVFYREGGELKTKIIPLTNEGILADSLFTITNWQARLVWHYLKNGTKTEEVPLKIDPSTIPNKRYLQDTSYGPGYKRAIQNLMKKWNPRTENASKLVLKLSKLAHLRKYVRKLMVACKHAKCKIANINVGELQTEQLMFYAGEFETMYFPIAAERFGKQ